jgi:hypothetical protein
VASPADGIAHTLRGGAWTTTFGEIQAALRLPRAGDLRPQSGFRCARNTTPPTATIPVCATPLGSGAYATYDFTGSPGTQNSTAVTTVLPGVTATDVSRSAMLTPTAAVDAISSSDWSSGPLDPARYYTFTITPMGLCTLRLQSLLINVASNATGPKHVAFATSVDKFAKPVIVAPGYWVITLPAAALAPIEVRVYGYDAQLPTGTMRIQNTLTVTGALD